MRGLSQRPLPLGALLCTVATSLVLAGPAAARRPHALCKAAAEGDDVPVVAILSAFPAELAPLVAATDVDATVEVDGRSYYTGRLGGVHVVLGLLGIGMLNADARAKSVLDHFPVAAVVVSGVAGGAFIGDVMLAERWLVAGRPRAYRVNVALLELARRAEAARTTPLESCTPIPPTDPEAPVTCLLHAPEVVFGGIGESGDPFGDTPWPCVPGGNEIGGCELPALAVAAESPAHADEPLGPSRADAVTPDVEDMESAAVARVAARRHVPFLAVRAASDGAGDPLGDRGFPFQFFDYYRLAAANEAIVTRGLVEELGALARDDASRRVCRLFAKRRWKAAARRLRSQ